MNDFTATDGLSTVESTLEAASELCVKSKSQENLSEQKNSLLALASNFKEETILHKIVEKRRLSAEDGLYLFTQMSLDTLRKAADYRRKLMCGDEVIYATTLYIHPTNLCELSCPMCSFYAKPSWKSAWFLSPDDVEQSVRSHLNKGITEIHVVGGLWKEANLPYYQDIFTRIKNIDSSLHIKALTPVEYDYLANLHGIPVEEVLSKMQSWGLGSLPGGGAEILVEEIRKAIAPQKITSERYLEIHKIAHTMGLRSNITMLYGHIESPEHIVTHLCRVRELQDKTSGFRTFVPLKYHLENNALGKRLARIKPKCDIRIFCVSRLMLDNVQNLKVLWNYLGIEKALDLLDCGGNDLGATAIDERIIKMAGGIDIKMTAEGMDKLILSKSRVPKPCHSGAT